MLTPNKQNFFTTCTPVPLHVTGIPYIMVRLSKLIKVVWVGLGWSELNRTTRTTDIEDCSEFPEVVRVVQVKIINNAHARVHTRAYRILERFFYFY